MQMKPVAIIGNRKDLAPIAKQFQVPFRYIPWDDRGPAESAVLEFLDEQEVDFLILARFMKILSPNFVWRYKNKIINIHPSLLPSFPGPRPYHDAYASRMLTYGATCHFIVPELDAGNQIINQSTYTVPPGMKLDEIMRLGQEDNEPRCLVEGVRRVVAREVQLHFHRVIARK